MKDFPTFLATETYQWSLDISGVARDIRQKRQKMAENT